MRSKNGNSIYYYTSNYYRLWCVGNLWRYVEIMKELLQVGDIFIVDPDFLVTRTRYGTKWDNGDLKLDKSTIGIKPYEGIINYTKKLQKVIDGKTWKRKEDRTLNTMVEDKKIFSSKWLVIKARKSGGGTGHGPHDVYPDGWQVTAVRLTKKLESAEEKISFAQNGCFNNMIEPVRITLVKAHKEQKKQSEKEFISSLLK